jgi:hypothetical protein
MEALKEYTQYIDSRDFDIRISSFDGEQVVLGALIYGKEEYENYATKS